MVKKSTKTANKVTDKLPNEVPTIWKFKKQIKIVLGFLLVLFAIGLLLSFVSFLLTEEAIKVPLLLFLKEKYYPITGSGN